MASQPSAVVTSLPGLTPAAMPPSNESVTSHEDTGKKGEAMSNAKVQPLREPKLLFAVAKNVANASNATRSKKQLVGGVKSPVTEGNGSMRTMFGIIKRVQTTKTELPVAEQQSVQEEHIAKPQPPIQETNEVQTEQPHTSASLRAKDRADSDEGAHDFVDTVRETLENIVTVLDSVDPRKLLAVRLGGELRGLLGKAQDEFAAYEAEFTEHAASEGVSVALQNFSASLSQVVAIAERLRTAKFLLNRTFKREILFAFQEINSYYTSLFMELSMAVARQSGIALSLPAPVTPPKPVEILGPTADEICLKAHQYFFGHGVARNLQRAREIYKQAADLGCATAMTCLGQMLFTGKEVEKDLKVAEELLERAVSLGEIEACHQLGLLMCEKAAHLKASRQSDEFLALARIRFTQAAEQGHCDAQFDLGNFHEQGRGGFVPDEMEAAIWYGKAAEQGHTGAEASLGRLFLVGTQMRQDVAKAVHFLQRAAAKSDSSAQTRLGLLYTTGNGVKQDMERGVAFLQSAADSGSSVAMTRLASLLLLHTPPTGNELIPISFYAQFRDREESHDEALRLLLNAGNGGHTDAFYELGKLLESSSLLRDQTAALRFYSKAAAAVTPQTKAAKRVATMRYSGIGCSVDKAKAHQYYTIAAGAGDAEALNALGLMYEEGDGCDLNFLSAAECYRSAAKLDCPHAHFNLGCLLLYGKGVPRNADAAQAHFRKALELGYSLAQQFLHGES